MTREQIFWQVGIGMSLLALGAVAGLLLVSQDTPVTCKLRR
jgi:hypothetical protein